MPRWVSGRIFFISFSIKAHTEKNVPWDNFCLMARFKLLSSR